MKVDGSNTYLYDTFVFKYHWSVIETGHYSDMYTNIWTWI